MPLSPHMLAVRCSKSLGQPPDECCIGARGISGHRGPARRVLSAVVEAKERVAYRLSQGLGRRFVNASLRVRGGAPKLGHEEVLLARGFKRIVAYSGIKGW